MTTKSIRTTRRQAGSAEQRRRGTDMSSGALRNEGSRVKGIKATGTEAPRLSALAIGLVLAGKGVRS